MKRFAILFFSFVFLFLISVVSASEKQVVDRFWDILLRSPRKGTALERVYGFYVDTGHAGLLLERCGNLVEREPENAKFQLVLGLVLQRRGEASKAVEAFKAATQLDSKDATAPFYLGQVLVDLGRLDEAVAALEESVRRKPGRADLRSVLTSLAEILSRLGDFEKAQKIWDELETKFSDDPDFLARIAEILESEGRYEDALKRYRRLAEKTQDDFAKFRYTMATADLEIRLGNEAAALQEFDDLLDRLAPESWLAESVRNRVEKIFRRKNNETGLAEFYEKRFEIRPDDFASLRQWTACLIRLDRNAEAEKLLTQAVEKSPDSALLRRSLAEVLFSQKQVGAAAEQYRELCRIEPKNPDNIVRWGELVLSNSKLDPAQRKVEATRIWSRLTQNAPNDPTAAVTVGDLLVQNELLEPAEAFYRKAVELRPDEISYREFLAQYFYGRRQKERVLETLQPLLDGDKRSVQNLLAVGKLLQTFSYGADAFKLFREAAERAPEDSNVQWAYAEALIRQGELDAAVTQLTRMERLLESDDDFDLFLQREVSFLGSIRKLAAVTKILEQRLSEIEIERYLTPGLLESRTTPPGLPTPMSLARSFWRLAVYREKVQNRDEAVAAIETALKITPPSARLRQAAAELYDNSGRFDRAIEIYEDLARTGGVWKVEYLKRLATLQAQAGQTEKALETGRLLMGLGSGNAANIRFYADQLLKLGRRQEAVETLRQSLRGDPGDLPTMKRLAKTLAEENRFDEAVELFWRVYEKTDDVLDKLQTIETITTCYRKLDQLGRLFERLQNVAGDAKTRCIAALSLARVFCHVDAPRSARQVLEKELDRSGNLSEDQLSEIGSVLLRELVTVTENLNALDAAVRYQERLAKRTRLSTDFDRLFDLYDKAGEIDKARELFSQQILLKTDLKDQLSAIDRMIRREQYDAVRRVLAFLEIHDPANWEVPFRLIAVEAYLGEDVSERVWDFRDSDFPDNKSPKPLAVPDLSKEPWILPGLTEIVPNLLEDASKDFATKISRQELYLLTLFRDRLKRNENYRAPNNVEPPKPFLEIDNFFEARYLVFGWLIKQSFSEDSETKIIDELRKELPEDSPDAEIREERRRLELWFDKFKQINET